MIGNVMIQKEKKHRLLDNSNRTQPDFDCPATGPVWLEGKETIMEPVKMLEELKTIFPTFNKDIMIETRIWEYDYMPGTHLSFGVWNENQWLKYNDSIFIPFEEWDSFINHYKILFRKF